MSTSSRPLERSFEGIFMDGTKTTFWCWTWLDPNGQELRSTGAFADREAARKHAEETCRSLGILKPTESL